MDKSIMIANALSVGYGRKTVVEDICLMAVPGQILTLIGPNGSGKSTILKTLIRQLPPLSGTVFLEGRSMPRMSHLEIARSVSAVLTGRPEPELMTCEDVVRSGRYPYTGRLGILSEADQQKVDEAMTAVGITDLRDRDFNRISDGQRQRVMLARAICQEPKLLILDEPTSFLDIRNKLDFLYLLKALVRERQLAVILSLHELDLAQKFSDTLLCIRDGGIDRWGTPAEIFTDGYIEQLYGVKHGRYDVRFGSVEAEPPHGAPLVFVIGGGGSGIPVYRKLQRMDIPFAAGVLPENDLDLPVASALATEVIRERAFEPVSAEAVQRAMEVLTECRYLVCCTEIFGTMNRGNRQLLTFAEKQNIILPVGELARLWDKTSAL